MAVAYQNHGTVNSGTDASLETSAPASVAVGDLLILVVMNEVNPSPTFTTPTDWTPIGTDVNGATTANRIAAYWRIATGGGDDTPTVTQGASGNWRSFIARYTGHDPVTPIQTSSTANASSTTIAIPVLSVSRNDSLSILAACNAGTSYTFPGTWVENEDSLATSQQAGLGYKAVNAGNTATENLTLAVSNRVAIVHAVIQPPAAGGNRRRRVIIGGGVL